MNLVAHTVLSDITFLEIRSVSRKLSRNQVEVSSKSIQIGRIAIPEFFRLYLNLMIKTKMTNLVMMNSKNSCSVIQPDSKDSRN